MKNKSSDQNEEEARTRDQQYHCSLTIKEKAIRLMKQEVRELYEKHELYDILERSKVKLYTSEWTKKNGQARYNQSADKTHHGKMVFSDNGVDEHMLISNRKMIEQGKEEEFIDTVRHELAHIIAYANNGNKSMGHKRKWKRWAKKFGADPNSTHDKFDVDDFKYVLYCGNGCYEKKYRRKSQKIKNHEHYICVKCEENLKVATKEEWLGEHNDNDLPRTV